MYSVDLIDFYRQWFHWFHNFSCCLLIVEQIDCREAVWTRRTPQDESSQDDEDEEFDDDDEEEELSGDSDKEGNDKY